eukprot:2212848-Pleurochrysis_carterae.AAC.1
MCWHTAGRPNPDVSVTNTSTVYARVDEPVAFTDPKAYASSARMQAPVAMAVSGKRAITASWVSSVIAGMPAISQSYKLACKHEKLRYTIIADEWKGADYVGSIALHFSASGLTRTKCNRTAAGWVAGCAVKASCSEAALTWLGRTTAGELGACAMGCAACGA